jgi:hypothetical protein
MRRSSLCVQLIYTAALSIPTLMAQGPPLGFVSKLGEEMDVRSGARVFADDVATGKMMLPELVGSVTGGTTVPQIQLRGGNVQVNDPAQTTIQTFTGFRPFVRATRSETSAAASGKNIVVTYNNSTGIHVSPNPSGPGLIVDRVQLSGYSTSNDGGQTWKSGYIPGSVGTTDTFGDPSVDVDRHGVFYFANLAANAAGHGTIQVNRSTDGGNTWSLGVIVQVDDERVTRSGWRLAPTRRQRIAITYMSLGPAFRTTALVNCALVFRRTEARPLRLGPSTHR